MDGTEPEEAYVAVLAGVEAEETADAVSPLRVDEVIAGAGRIEGWRTLCVLVTVAKEGLDSFMVLFWLVLRSAPRKTAVLVTPVLLPG